MQLVAALSAVKGVRSLQGKDVSSVRQYIESSLVNLMLRDPVPLLRQHVLPALHTYHAK